MSTQNKKKNTGETDLAGHKQHKKQLTPPFLQIPKLKHSSWIHDRLPDMLWAVIVIGNMERNKALDFFKYVGRYVSKHNEFFDISLTGIGKLPSDKVKEFIKYLLDYSNDIANILRPLRLYAEVPASEIWNQLLEDPVSEEDWKKILEGVNKTYNHQSQEATDCRWIKVLCLMLGGKMKFQSDMEETVKGIVNYPNYGDMKKVRPSIRAAEIILNKNDLKWPKQFWKHNYNSTDCVPEEVFSKKIKLRQEKLSKEIETRRKHFIDETKKVRDELITHFFKSCEDTKVDTRRETSFGLALYGLTFFTEIIFYSVPSSITGRVALRTLIENYITFKYLLKKEQEEPKIWDDFHNYGTGQTKLIYLKLKELAKQSKCVEIDELNVVVNEDKWAEFIPINLGQWGNSDLRKMSEYAEVKEVYDLYYNYTSGFVHGTRGALRESIYQTCLNPLHRFHRIPIFDLPLMPSVILDSLEIVNNILDCLNAAYPPFDCRIKDFEEKDKVSEKH